VKLEIHEEIEMKRVASITWLAVVLLISGVIGFSCTQTERHEIRGEVAEYRAGDTIMRGYLSHVRDGKGKHPGILVVHEWWGINKHVKKMADMLAGQGYTVLAVDLYGEGKQAENFEQASGLAQSISGNSELRMSRLRAAMDFLRSRPDVDPNKMAAIGYSFGGNVVLQSALDGLDINGVVSIYGGFLVKVPESREGIKARILIMHGEKDWYVTPQMLTAFNTAMNRAGIDYDIITYKDAEHGFDNPDCERLAEKFRGMHIKYDKEAAEKSWEDLKKFLSTLFYEI
jgi:dienelactone hydrolase